MVRGQTTETARAQAPGVDARSLRGPMMRRTLQVLAMPHVGSELDRVNAGLAALGMNARIEPTGTVFGWPVRRSDRPAAVQV